MIVAFVLWSIVSLVFLGIGISCRRSKEAVGFFTFVKPPEVEETGRYNRAVGILWFMAAGIFEVLTAKFALFYPDRICSHSFDPGNDDRIYQNRGQI